MNIDSPLKSAPDFQTWQQETLAKFAHDAYAKLCEQEDELVRLRLDLKTAISAYRDLLRK